MPGFKINGSGGGDRDPSNTIQLLHNHRWHIETFGPITAKKVITCRDLALPDMKIDRQEVLGGLVWYKFAKSVRWDDAQVMFYDDNKVSPELDKWREEVFTVKDGVKSHNQYKKDCVFVLTDGTGGELQRFTLKHAWPSVISPGKLTYTNSEIKLVTVMITFDYLEFTAGGATSSGGTNGTGGGSSGGASSGSGGPTSQTQAPTGAANVTELLNMVGAVPRDIAAIDKAVGFNAQYEVE